MARSIRGMLVSILVALKDIYTFRDPESVLAVPQNTLWKYTSLSMVPEEPTAKRILERLRGNACLRRLSAGCSSTFKNARSGEATGAPASAAWPLY